MMTLSLVILKDWVGVFFYVLKSIPIIIYRFLQDYYEKKQKASHSKKDWQKRV